jgi:hypothetical protein
MAERQWPKGTHKVDLAQMASGHEHHRWFLAEHERQAEGYLSLLWVCPCGAYVRRVITAPYLDGTKVPDVHDEPQEAPLPG